MFPLGDDNSNVRTVPFVVYALIAINALVFLLQMTVGDPFTYAWAAVPFEITSGVDIVRPVVVQAGGESFSIPQYPGPTPIYLTLLSSMFMHGSLMHIGGNMLYLWIFGDQVEDLLGHWRFGVFYLVCGLVADFAHILPDPGSVIPTLGASGAIAGVLGAYLVKFPQNRVRVLLIRIITSVPAIVVLGLWFVFQFVSQLAEGPAGGGVAYLAHIGGFLAGMVLVYVFAIGRRAPERS